MSQSSFLGFLNHWWNLPYMVMLGLVAVFFVLQMVGMFGGGGDHDADVDGDIDADVDHDVDVDADHDVDVNHDADVDHDAEADHDADGHGLGWQAALSFFGV